MTTRLRCAGVLLASLTIPLLGTASCGSDAKIGFQPSSGTGGHATGTTSSTSASSTTTSSSTSASSTSTTTSSSTTTASSTSASSTSTSSSSSSSTSSTSASSSSSSGGAPGAACTANAQCTNGICGVAGAGTHCCEAACTAAGACDATDCDGTGACVFPAGCMANPPGVGAQVTAPTCSGDLVAAANAACAAMYAGSHWCSVADVNGTGTYHANACANATVGYQFNGGVKCAGGMWSTDESTTCTGGTVNFKVQFYVNAGATHQVDCCT